MQKKQNAFTLMEMLIVLLIITVLILLFIPQITKHAKGVQDKGCSALVLTVQSQAEAYYLEEDAWPSISELVSSGYITEDQKACKSGDTLTIDSQGKVTSSGS